MLMTCAIPVSQDSIFFIFFLDETQQYHFCNTQNERCPLFTAASVSLHTQNSDCPIPLLQSAVKWINQYSVLYLTCHNILTQPEQLGSDDKKIGARSHNCQRKFAVSGKLVFAGISIISFVFCFVAAPSGQLSQWFPLSQTTDSFCHRRQATFAWTTNSCTDFFDVD